MKQGKRNTKKDLPVQKEDRKRRKSMTTEEAIAFTKVCQESKTLLEVATKTKFPLKLVSYYAGRLRRRGVGIPRFHRGRAPVDYAAVISATKTPNKGELYLQNSE